MEDEDKTRARKGKHKQTTEVKIKKNIARKETRKNTRRETINGEKKIN